MVMLNKEVTKFQSSLEDVRLRNVTGYLPSFCLPSFQSSLEDVRLRNCDGRRDCQLYCDVSILVRGCKVT